MKHYLTATDYLDAEHPRIQDFVKTTVEGAADEREKAVRLYYAVRDGVRYNPYRFGTNPDDFKASNVLEAGEAFCVPKAILLATAARAAGIPSRLGFADVKNHLSSPKLLDALRTDVFTFHGYAELLLEGKWIKATPAFNKELCAKFRVAPLEWDGQTDAVFQSFDEDGKEFMQYLADHGTYADFPLDAMVEAFRKHYPHFFGEDAPSVEGADFAAEAEAQAINKGHGTIS